MNTQSRLLMNNTPPMSGPGSMQLWFATSICLDSDSGYQANEWFNLEGEYIEFGTANQASFSVEVIATGAGAPDVELYFERTQLAEGDQEEFEYMNPAAISLTQGHQWIKRIFGRTPTTAGDLNPRGAGRIHLINTSATDAVFITIRVWVALSKYERRGGR
ncbi:MAG: hypothetical protein H6747_09535 [Deltaproteobacteria bacterium]|nr:hypothetical protein [Deltaproteobacteria bacterium]